MMKSSSLRRLVLLLLLFSGGALHAQRSIVLSGVTMIDGLGKRPVEDVNIVVQGGIIMGVGEKEFVIMPPDAEVIDLHGKFVIPGLVDMNARWRSERDLRAMLAWGVTSVNSFFATPAEAQNASKFPDADRLPRIFATTPVFSVPGGLFSEGGRDSSIDRFPATPEEARNQVRRAKAQGSTRISVAYDAMEWAGTPLPKMNGDILRAIGEEAAAQEMTLYVQTTNVIDAEEAQEAGARAFACGIVDDRLNAPFIGIVAQKGEVYIPTISHYAYLADAGGFVAHILAEDRFRASLPDSLVKLSPDTTGAKSLPAAEYLKTRVNLPGDNMMAVIGNYGNACMGTDLADFPGIAAHLEMENMVKAGLKPIQALAVATTLGGQLLGTTLGVGSIFVGQKADLVILDADPAADIRNTRAIRTVMKGGIMYDHKSLLKALK